MGASLLITLREGLEMAIIVAILLAYLRMVGRNDRRPAVWAGVGVAAALCIAAAVLFDWLVGSFEDSSAEPWIEGLLALTAGLVLTGMIFWMRSHARGIAGHLHARLDDVIERGPMAVALIAFVAVAREGFETVLFLLGAQEAGAKSGWSTVVGGTIGLAISVGIAVLIYGYGHRIDLRKFFTVTGGLLILFAAGLLAKAAFELVEAMHIEALEGTSMWTITSGPLAHGWFHDFLEGMFGWTSNEASPLRVAVYFAYLLPVAYLFFFGGRSAQPSQRRTSAVAAH